MNIPTWEELSQYILREKNGRIPETFYNKFEYIRNYFLGIPFTEQNLRRMFSEIRQDLYYRQGQKVYTQAINEYIYITKLIAEYHGFLKKQVGDIMSSGSLKMDITWEDLKAFYYVRKHNRSEEYNYRGKFDEIQKFFIDKSFTVENIDGFFLHLRQRFITQYNQEISTSYYNKYLSILRVIGKLLKTDIVENFQSMKNKYKETEVLTSDEFEHLVSVSLPYELNPRSINHRWRTLIKTLIITTCRVGELRYARWQDLKGNYLYFEMTKNGEPHKVYIPDSLLSDINKLERSTLHDYIFGGHVGPFDKVWFNQELRDRCKKAGITKHITARSLRATGITSYLKKYEPHKVAKISNHKTLDVMYKHYYKPDHNEIEDIVRHNEIQPDEPTPDEVLEAYRKVSEKFKKTMFGKKLPIIEQYIEKLIYGQI